MQERWVCGFSALVLLVCACAWTIVVAEVLVLT